MIKIFCSPFRMRRKKKAEEFLTREEAWQMYFNKLDEEANYFTVTEETEEDICTCTTCIASYELLFAEYFNHSKATSKKIANDKQASERLVSDSDKGSNIKLATDKVCR